MIEHGWHGQGQHNAVAIMLAACVRSVSWWVFVYFECEIATLKTLRLSCVNSLPMTKMTNTDLSRLLKSDEIQKALRPPK